MLPFRFDNGIDVVFDLETIPDDSWKQHTIPDEHAEIPIQTCPVPGAENKYFVDFGVDAHITILDVELIVAIGINPYLESVKSAAA